MNKYEYNEELSNLKDQVKQSSGRWFKEEDLTNYSKEQVQKITTIYYQFKENAKRSYRKTFVYSTIILSVILIFDSDINAETLLMVFTMAFIFSFIAYAVKIKDVSKPPRLFRKITSRNRKSKFKSYFSFVAGIIFTLLCLDYAMDGSSNLTPYSVSVDGYTRSDGTEVRTHNRRPPGSVARDRNYKTQEVLGIFGGIAGGFIVVISGFSITEEKND